MNNQSNTGWVLCPACGHKLFKVEYSQGGTKISVKCHSCKTISDVILLGGKQYEAVAQSTVTGTPR